MDRMFHLLQTPYLIIARVPGFDVIHFKRLSLALYTLETLHKAMNDAIAAMDTLDRGRFSLLLDVREAPLRTDPEFEQVFAMYRAKLLGGFAKIAVLLKTEVGKLQAMRMGREDKLSFRTFIDEREAMSYLTGSDAKAR